MKLAVTVAGLLLGAAGCERSTDDVPTAQPIGTSPGTTLSIDVVAPSATTTTAAPSTTASETSSTVAPPTTTSSTTTSSTTTSSTTTTVLPTSTPYRVPVADVGAAGWGETHSSYPATDIFAGGCGARLVSPVNGTLLEVRRVNSYDPSVDNPATRGGLSVSILGDDGVRYYMAHFETIVESLLVGDRVGIGQELGSMGTTGRSSACHLHFAISPPCPGKEWSVRRGVVWPYPYLDAWRRGESLSPVDEVTRWAAANPNACAEAMTDRHASDA